MIVQQVLHTMRRKQGETGYMAIKADLEKEYDRLRWSFIEETLKLMGLPRTLTETIMCCVSSSSMQILWNGSPSKPFKPSRGVRQGDPLSPYLFVLCMERLNHIIQTKVSCNLWKPIRCSRRGPNLSNLFFADDLILFVEATLEKASVVKNCLDEFCVVSGEKVSLHKSSVLK